MARKPLQDSEPTAAINTKFPSYPTMKNKLNKYYLAIAALIVYSIFGLLWLGNKH